jgi:hypothetical protein
MTVLLALISGAGITATVTASRYRRIIRQLDTHGYDSHRTADDIRALDQELAVAIADKGQWRRRYVWAEQVARDQAEQLATHWRTPIPLPARRNPISDYGTTNR